MTGSRQMTIGNRKGAKTNCLGERMTLLGKKVRSRGKGQCPIDKGQLQYHAHVICDLELGIGLRIFPICPQIYEYVYSGCCTLLMHISGPNDLYSGCLTMYEDPCHHCHYD